MTPSSAKKEPAAQADVSAEDKQAATNAKRAATRAANKAVKDAAIADGGDSTSAASKPEPKKRGPKGAHKLTDDVVDFLDKAREEIPCPKAAALARRVHDRFGLSVHPRSIEKALTRQKKERTS